MTEKMTPEKCKELFHTGIDCSQVTFALGAEMLGFDKDTAMKIAAAFGGGMFNGDTCGAVSGCLMALGLKYGHLQNDPETKEEMTNLTNEFEQAFIEENGSLICRDLLGYDISNPEDVKIIMEKGLLDKICPVVTSIACEILEDML